MSDLNTTAPSRRKNKRLAAAGSAMAVTLLVTACGGSDSDDAPASQAPIATVRTASGPVTGAVGEITSFKGIPYAAPPVGNLRWKAPQPAPAWTTARNATAFGPACIQGGTTLQSEDCLTLNVWTTQAALQANERRPVLVWVYGGSFHGGNGNIDADALTRAGVVVVSMNYRVSTLGFLAHPALSSESAEKTSGNYGLLDIAASLKWVRDNIQNFGGDPTKITVWGQSSGASAITALMVSPKAAGLYDQVILDSPGAFRHWKTLPQAEQDGLAVGASLDALRALPADQLPVIRNTGSGTAIRALAEPRVIGPTLDKVVLPAEERPTFERGAFKAVPTLVGYNTDEGTSFTQNYPIKTLAQYAAYLLDPTIFANFGTEALTVYPAATDAAVPRAVADSFSDNQFVYGTRGIARAMTTAGQPVYRYWFKRRASGTGQDPLHGAELAYVRGDAVLNAAPYNQDDRTLSATMKDAWVRFVKTGNPNGGTINNWPRYDVATEPVYVLDTPLSVTNAPRTKELDFIGKVDAALNPR
ncbi:carboxylic ester hydrolase [Pigmentiphaga litoralis]|uniref:carboxylesterase/lipase family protein n=1 Tax=Pigmentiphaga litoralis TaxID=516702 RepID=UPI0016762A97|nr:carboxylesterase family protein [Pigmentiphaga litoralis]GGX16163.1 carboxylic ester hydrolase [Pigmentiphaga litoralis]